MSESNTKPRVPADELKATTAEILGRYVESANAHGVSLATMKLQLHTIAVVIRNAARDLNQDKVDELAGSRTLLQEVDAVAVAPIYLKKVKPEGS